MAKVLLKTLELQFFELFGFPPHQMPLVFEGCQVVTDLPFLAGKVDLDQ